MVIEPTVVVLSEDEQVVQLVLRMLDDHGFNIHAVLSCHAGMRTLRNLRRLDLLIADALTATSSEIDLVREVKTSFPNVAVLYLSDVVAASIGLRSMAVIVKPFTKTELVNAVAAVLALRDVLLSAD